MTSTIADPRTVLLVPDCGLDYEAARALIETLVWGEPIIMGPRGLHIYGALRGAWKPVNVELRARGGGVCIVAVGGEDALKAFWRALDLDCDCNWTIGAEKNEPPGGA